MFGSTNLAISPEAPLPPFSQRRLSSIGQNAIQIKWFTMRFISSRKINGKVFLPHQMLFLDCWHGLTHHHSLDSFRVKCLNSRTIVKELSDELEIGRIHQNYKLMNNLSIWPSMFWGPNLTMSKFLDSLVVSSRLRPVNSGWVIEVGVKADLIREYGTQDLTDRVFIELNEEFYSRPSQAGLVRLEKFARVVPRGCTIEVMNIDVVRN